MLRLHLGCLVQRVIRVVSDDGAKVVVDAEKVGGRGNALQVAGMDGRHRSAGALDDLRRVATSVERVEEPAVRIGIVAPGGRAVRLASAGGMDRRQVERNANGGA